MRTEEMLKGIDALQELLRSMEDLKKDAITFIAEKGLGKEFLAYHFKKCIERKQKEG